MGRHWEQAPWQLNDPLLLNAQAVAELHNRSWLLPKAQLSPWWKLAMRHYNSLTDRNQTALYR